MRSRFAPLVLAAVAAASLVACSSSDGRTLPPPGPHQTTTSVSTPVVGRPSEDTSVPTVLTLTSPDFVDGGVIPSRHTCAGENLSPPLIWTTTPPGAELALVVRDRDAEGFVHWVVTGIDSAVQGIGEGSIPEGGIEAANSSGTTGWFGPCPPAGSGTHHYDFVLHVLPEQHALDPALPAADAARLVEAASSAHAVLTGTVTAAG